MSKYVSITRWRDLEDGHMYFTGEKFPHDGREISDERIAELQTTQNRAGVALIKALPDTDEEKPIQQAEKPKKAVRSRKKAD